MIVYSTLWNSGKRELADLIREVSTTEGNRTTVENRNELCLGFLRGTANTCWLLLLLLTSLSKKSLYTSWLVWWNFLRTYLSIPILCLWISIHYLLRWVTRSSRGKRTSGERVLRDLVRVDGKYMILNTSDVTKSLLDELRQLSTPVIRVLCCGNNNAPCSELSNFYIN